ncbi:MAG: peptidoglycan-binding protein [Solirubrobacteraceae bacterium]
MLTALAAGALLAAAPGAAVAASRPAITQVTCLRACVGAKTVAPGGLVRLRGERFSRGMRAAFKVAGGARHTFPTGVRSRRMARVTVPQGTVAGPFYVRDRAGRRSNAVKPLRIAAPAVARTPKPAPAAAPATATGTAFDGNGMWIWYVSRTAGGDPAAIVAQAKAHGVSTVFVKSADGTTAWSQFSAPLVAALKAGGLDVCAWQYVYGTRPDLEAQVAAQTIAAGGADCFVIDAETEYQGRYAQAQRYVTALRAALGDSYPIGFTSFPYVDYHPSLPYSVFLGPGGAQFNAPQIYWKAIGGGVDAVVDHTYQHNRPYARPIVPLGQLYDGPSTADVLRFRQLLAQAGATGVSWWDWQHAESRHWDAIGQPLVPLALPVLSPDMVTLKSGMTGDLVIWAQQHLNGAGYPITVNGRYDATMTQTITAYQAGMGLSQTGQIDTLTWQALLRSPAAVVDWAAQR